MNIDKVIVITSALIKDRRGKVLLLQRSKKSSHPGFWQLVEGKIVSGESPTEALKREVKEETKTKVSKLILNSVFYNEIEAKGLNYLCFRIVFNTIISSSKIRIGDEHVSFGWFSQSEIAKLALLPGTTDIFDGSI